jgi:hypothetical protein
VYTTGTVGTGGSGGGGAGGQNGATGTAGTNNTGGGGGGAGTATSGGPFIGGNGGSGIVILRYPITRTISNPGGGLTFTTTTVDDFKVTSFTAGTGNIQFT